MSARPLRPVPLVSRPRPAGQPAPGHAWRLRRWPLAGVAAFSLAGLLAMGGVRGRVFGSEEPVVATPPPSAPAAAAPVPTDTATPEPTATATGTPASTATPPPAPTSTPALLNESIARTAVERYYSLVNARDLRGAYGLLGAEWHKRQTYEDFSTGYPATLRDTVDVTATAAATKDGAGGYLVALDLHAQIGGRVRRYKGLYFVALEAGQPRIVSGELSPQ